jgi:hypothetical protein
MKNAGGIDPYSVPLAIVLQLSSTQVRSDNPAPAIGNYVRGAGETKCLAKLDHVHPAGLSPAGLFPERTSEILQNWNYSKNSKMKSKYHEADAPLDPGERYIYRIYI